MIKQIINVNLLILAVIGVQILIIGATTELSLPWATLLSIPIALIINNLMINKLARRAKKRDFAKNWQKVGERWDEKR